MPEFEDELQNVTDLAIAIWKRLRVRAAPPLRIHVHHNIQHVRWDPKQCLHLAALTVALCNVFKLCENKQTLG